MYYHISTKTSPTGENKILKVDQCHFELNFEFRITKFLTFVLWNCWLILVFILILIIIIIIILKILIIMSKWYTFYRCLCCLFYESLPSPQLDIVRVSKRPLYKNKFFYCSYSMQLWLGPKSMERHKQEKCLRLKLRLLSFEVWKPKAWLEIIGGVYRPLTCWTLSNYVCRLFAFYAMIEPWPERFFLPRLSEFFGEVINSQRYWKCHFSHSSLHESLVVAYVIETEKYNLISYTYARLTWVISIYN